ncbi:class I SAM-dependent DNA methyltransferase [Oceaniglobus roseus]|uniref:class I SAM-dependent DNA methyltransferase n=1 Tax=Oceaniglobus roseus TaxID=1737570 RepID=UPI000C7EBAD7|nr:class I SAM-dependent methyltransferase [Kandeliimicrobium roseum]
MTRDAASFDRLYRDAGDPWRYETSAYEADKYRRCLALLPRARYRRALEIGCSIGVMSGMIARRCDSLLALDFAPTAVARARARGIPGARFEVGAIPRDWPGGPWDLIVLSEVLYYLSRDDLDETVVRVARSLAPGGACLVAGYTGETETHLTAAGVEEILLSALAEAYPSHDVRRDAGPSWIAAAFLPYPVEGTGG